MKRKLLKVWLVVVLPVGVLVSLFALRDTFVRIGSLQMSRMQDGIVAATIADSVKILYDYRDRCDEGLRYTFLEFGSIGCISCRKMESVMKEIESEFGGRVKVRFMNVSKKEMQEWTKYFGVAAIPTQVVLDSTGREIFRHTGFISAEDLGKSV